jgi:hypothetical protein
VFCPNCGTQNPDAAQTCAKCNFHLKSAAAPKFKGTMLMMNQPGVLPGSSSSPPPPQAPPPQAPPAGRPGAALPPPPGAGAVPSKLKGTMVGVAPMAGPTPLPPPPAMSPHPPPAYGGQGGEAASAFSPPVPQPGVNPLGGTVAADAGVFGAFAAHQAQGHGAAPPYGAPPRGASSIPPPPAHPPAPPAGLPPAYGSSPGSGFPPPFGVPPPAPAPGAPPPYAAQSAQPGGPPPGYGGDPYAQPAHGVYGGTMQMPGAPPQGLAPYGQPRTAGLVGTLKSEAGMPAPTRRNAILTLVLPLALMFGGVIISAVLAFLSPALGSLAGLFVLGGWVWYLLLAMQMIRELRSVTRSDELAWWPLIVPLYNIYFMWFLVPQEVTKAKQMLGVRQAPQHILLYVFLWPFALATDINDMVR